MPTVRNPTLLKAKEEIEAILKRLDIAAVVVMHTAPQSALTMVRLDPSYSRLTLQGNVARLRSKLEEYGGDKEAQERDLAATANMTSQLAVHTAEMATMLLDLARIVDDETGAQHGPTEYESNEDLPH